MKNIISIPALSDNYVWMIFDEQEKEAWVIDPGDSKPVMEVLNKYHLNLLGILITHHHADHCAGIPDLLHQWKNIPVFGSHKSPNPYISHHLKEKDEVISKIFALEAIEIPGHTLDHMAYYGNGCLFSGDTLFSVGCGKIFEGTPEMMYSSLSKLQELDNETKIYCGHEYTLANLKFAQYVEPNNPEIKNKIKVVENLREKGECTLPAILKEEKKVNPFLRCKIPSLISSVENYVEKKLSNSIEVFASLREWKNNFVI